MKQFKIFTFLLLLFPLFSFGQSVQDQLSYINNQFSQYNSYRSSLSVSNNQLVFNNTYGAAYIPFKDIDFRINYKHKSIDIYCIDGSKCIKKGDSNWDYYNISMVEDGRIAKSIFETLDRCRDIRSNYVSNEKYVSYGSSEDDLLRYINRQFDLYNKYYSRFEIDQGILVFANKFGTCRIPFGDITFKVNPGSSSLEFHCKDGSKCIEKYDFDGSRTTWKYYNVSLVNADNEMVNEVYQVKDKCDKLQQLYTSNNNNNSNDGEINQLLSYINSQLSKYNSVGAQLNINKIDKTLIFSNNMSAANPVKFSDIGFRLSREHQSIDIYCLDNSKCIRKGNSDWDYYNMSMKNEDGTMASEIYQVLEECRRLRTLVMSSSNNVSNNSNSVDGLLDYINSQFAKYNSYASRFDIDEANKTITFSNSMSPAEPVYLSDVGFRLNIKDSSIDIYCLDNSKCIQKGGSNWTFYNISMKNKDDSMANEIYTVLEKCKLLKSIVLNNEGSTNDFNNSGNTTKNSRKTTGKRNTGSTEDRN